MKKPYYLVFLIALVSLCVSCMSDDETVLLQIQQSQSSRAVAVADYLNITYNGKTYEAVPTSYDVNGDFIFLDEEFSFVYATELAYDSNWSISITGSNDITFYPDLQTNLLSNKIEIINEVIMDSLNRSYPKVQNSLSESWATVTLYDDKRFKDRSVDIVLIKNSKLSWEVSNLGEYPYSFNDKCSSLIFVNDAPEYLELLNSPMIYSPEQGTKIEAVFIGYDDRNFSDRTITCVVPHKSRKEYPSLPGFNDKMSSCKLFIAKKGEYISTI